MRTGPRQHQTSAGPRPAHGARKPPTPGRQETLHTLARDRGLRLSPDRDGPFQPLEAAGHACCGRVSPVCLCLHSLLTTGPSPSITQRVLKPTQGKASGGRGPSGRKGVLGDPGDFGSRRCNPAGREESGMGDGMGASPEGAAHPPSLGATGTPGVVLGVAGMGDLGVVLGPGSRAVWRQERPQLL